jgi:hypothetical protein
VVEAAILVSRPDLLPREKIEQEMACLANAVRKTAGPSELQAWDWLVERVRARHPGGHKDYCRMRLRTAPAGSSDGQNLARTPT